MSETPKFGEPVPSCHPSQDTLTLLAHRRSTPVKLLTTPGPDDTQMAKLIELGARVSDHRRVVPFHFITFTGKAREEFGRALGHIYKAEHPQCAPEEVTLEEQRFLRAPVIIAVISSPDRAHKTPVWEQYLTAGAVCQNLLIAANAMGFASQWLTEWYAFDPAVHQTLGMTEDEQVAGFIYIGTASEPPLERPRVDAATLVTQWGSTTGHG
ncbi:MAG: nitroreductase family protein [bacterium]